MFWSGAIVRGSTLAILWAGFDDGRSPEFGILLIHSTGVTGGLKLTSITTELPRIGFLYSYLYDRR